MNQVYSIAFVILIALSININATPLTSGNILATENIFADISTVDGSCSSNGTLLELTSEGQLVQQIKLPADCLFFANVYAGFITLSRDRMSAVVPCCIDPNVTPQTVGFVQIYFDGTTSSMKTVKLPVNATEPHNIVLDGNDLWFVGRNYQTMAPGYAQLYYANLTSDTAEAVPLGNQDLFFVDIVNNELLVSNFFQEADGLFQVGSELPKTENQTLTPLLNLSNVLDGFVHADTYAYYSQYSPDKALVRCDPNTWQPLYSLNFTDEFVHFAVVHNNDTDVIIVGSMFNAQQSMHMVGYFHDDGKQITLVNVTDTGDYFIKIGSLTPNSHCTNNKTDFDETDVDCGGSLCDTCQVGKKCSSNGDCASNSCGANNTCVEPEPVASPNASSTTPTSTPTQGKTSNGTAMLAHLSLATALLVFFAV